jgi:hypothetical protein
VIVISTFDNMFVIYFNIIDDIKSFCQQGIILKSYFYTNNNCTVNFLDKKPQFCCNEPTEKLSI